MDLNILLDRHQRSLMRAGTAETAVEQKAHDQFARDYAEQIRSAREAGGAAPAHRGAVT